jgi:hypothetical protein
MKPIACKTHAVQNLMFPETARNFSLLCVVMSMLGCTSAREMSHTACPFAYSSKIKLNIVMPQINRIKHELSSLYDLDNPAISQEGKTTSLIFNQTSNALDTPTFIIEMDSCTLKVTKAFESNGVDRSRP